MNPCPKCGGLLVSERDLIEGESTKCLNCGWRGGAMPRFTTEAGKQAWVAAMARRRGTKYKKTAISQPDGSVATRASGHSGGIAGALEEIEQKIAALEQVKRSLEQAQALVHG